MTYHFFADDPDVDYDPAPRLKHWCGWPDYHGCPICQHNEDTPPCECDGTAECDCGEWR